MYANGDRHFAIAKHFSRVTRNLRPSLMFMLCVYVDVCSDREGHSGLEREDRAPACPDGDLTWSHDMHGRSASYYIVQSFFLFLLTTPV